MLVFSSYLRNLLLCFTMGSYATNPLSRCYLRSYLVKNTAETHKEPSNKYKNNLRTLKSKSYEQCQTKNEYNTKESLMLPAHFHNASGDLFTIVENFLDSPEFWQCSCDTVLCSLNLCYIRVVFGIFRILILYFCTQ